MADIFLSYASEDRERVRRVAVALVERGWSLWWDRDITAGKTFDDVIERELEAARSVVVLWSRASVASEWVRSEATAAAERGILVPAAIEDVKPPLAFRRKHAADLARWNGAAADPGFAALCAGIEAVLGAPAPRSAPNDPEARVMSSQRRRRFWAAAGVGLALAGTAGVAAWWLRTHDPERLHVALVAAAENGDATAVRGLLARGADARYAGSAALKAAADARYWGSHSAASDAGQAETLHALLDAGADANTRFDEGLTPLMLVLRGEAPSPASLRKLLERDADVAARCDCSACEPRTGAQGCNALMIAASAGYRDAVQALLDKGARPNERNDQGRTAIMLTGNVEVLRMLLQRGADPNLQDEDGRTALIWATDDFGTGDEGVAALLASGANPSLEDTQGRSALAWAVIQGKRASVRALLDMGAPIDRATKEAAKAPLMLAVINGRTQIVRDLIDRRASLTPRDNAGKTALQLASERLDGQTRDEIVYLLKSAGAK